MFKGLKTKIAFVLLVSFILTLINTGNSQQPDVFVIAIPADPENLCQALHTSSYSAPVAGGVFNSLCSYSREPMFELKPDLAKSWEISADKMNFTFYLRDDVYWHDGVKFTSADVKYTIEEISSLHHPHLRSQLKNLLRVDTPDEYTASILLTEPNPDLVIYLACAMELAVQPKHLYEGTDPLTNEYNAKPVGTGPYMFKEWIKGERIVLEKNPNYFIEGLPHFDRVNILIISDDFARVSALEKGEIDYIPAPFFPISEYVRLKEDPNIVISDKGYEAVANERWLALNLREMHLKDLRVRQALAHAINRDELSELAGYGLNPPTYGYVTKESIWYNPAAAELMPKYDPDKAEALLDEAGYPRGTDGVRFTLRITFESLTEVLKTMEVVADQWKEVGVNVQLRALERVTALDEVYNQWDFDVWVIPGKSTGPTFSILASIFLSSSIKKGLLWGNNMGYSNPRVDELFNLLPLETNTTVRESYVDEIQEIITKDLPVIPLWQVSKLSAWREGLVDLPVEIYVWGAWAGIGNTLRLPSPTDSEGELPIELIVLVVVAFILTILVIYVVMRRKKK